jgi:hypothetical protein
MFTKKLAIGSLALLMANVAFAQVPLVAVPMEDAGMFALAAACLAIGIRIIRRK